MVTFKKNKKVSTQELGTAIKRTYLKQADVPSNTLDDALRVPQAIIHNYAGKTTIPLHLAKALNLDPKGSQFRTLTGSAIAFGLIEGGAQATSITITDLAKRILKPTVEGGEIIAKRESVLNPRIFNEFLTHYDGSPIPRSDIAKNVLESMGVPPDKTNEVHERIITSAKSVGFLEEIKGNYYVSLQGIQPNVKDEIMNLNEAEGNTTEYTLPQNNTTAINALSQNTSLPLNTVIDDRKKRVFITHGKNQSLLEPIKKLLEFGDLIPVVSIQKFTVSKTIPEKVMDDMRSCGGAIIHIDAESRITDKAEKDHVIINPNVLIEIGAAMALYGQRFILLVKDEVILPSNLNGLFCVRYSNDTLDATSTIKLLDAIKDIKNYPLPTDTKS